MKTYACWMSAILLFLPLGCGKHSLPSGQGTPKAVIEKSQRALFAGNKAQFVECYTGPAGYEQVLDVVFDYGLMALEFHDTITKVYGPTAVHDLEMLSTDPSFFPVAPPRDVKWIDNLDIKVVGDKATFFDPNLENTVVLVRHDGIWQYSFSYGDATKAIEFYRTITNVVRKGISEATAPGMTLKDLKISMGKMFVGSNGKTNIQDEASSELQGRSTSGTNAASSKPTTSNAATVRKVLSAFSDEASELANAVNRNDAQAIKSWVAKGRNPDIIFMDGSTVLHGAVGMGRTECVIVLLESGANPNIADRDGRTPLHIAAQYNTPGPTEIVSRLLKAGANPTAKDATGKTPYDYALAKGYHDCAALLKNATTHPTTGIFNTTSSGSQ